MTSRRIAFFGNCQAFALAQLYRNHVAPLTGDTVTAVDIQNKKLDPEIVRDAVRSADHVVLQKFDFAPLLTREDLSPGTKYSLFPMMLGTFYWPYGLQDHPRNKPEPFLAAGPYSGQLGDRFLNKMINSGVDPDEAVQRYLDHDINRATNLDRMLELNIERQKIRDGDTGYAVHKVIETSYRDEYLFIVPGHPTLRLFSLVARQCYFDLGLPESLIDDVLNAQFKTPFPRVVLPIHPGVISHFGLTFVTPETRYEHLEDGMFTFAEFAGRYMRYEWNAELREAMSGTLPRDKALAKLEAALQRSPGSFLGWVYKAGLLLGLHRPAEAKVAAQQAIAVDPQHPTGFITLARVCTALGERVEAEAAARRAVTDCRPFPQSHRALGDALAALGRNSEAAEAYRAAIRLLPSDWRFHASLGHLHLRSGDAVQAETAYRSAIAAAPALLSPRGNLAEALVRQGKQDEAIALLRQMIADGVGEVGTRTRLGGLLLASGDTAGAEAVLRDAVATHRNAPAPLLALADAIARQERRAEAVALLRGAIAPDGDASAPGINALAAHAGLHQRLGNLLLQTGDPAGAETAFRAAIERAPESNGAKANLVEALERQGRRPEAIALLRELVATDTTDARMRIRLASLLLASGDTAGAEATFAEAIRLDPAQGAAHRGMAEVLEAQGRRDAAIARLREAVTAGVQDSHVHGWLGIYLLRAGDPGAAETAFHAALQGDRSDNYRLHLADALQAQNRPREAAEALRPLLHNGRASDERLQFRLGRLLQDADDLDGAEHAYRAALVANPASAVAQAALAGVLRQRGVSA